MFSTSTYGPGKQNVFKNNTWSLLVHKFNEISTKVCKNIAIYLITVSKSTHGLDVFINIPIPGLRHI